MKELYQEVVTQLQEHYISQYANGKPYLKLNGEQCYHFRMNLSYFYKRINKQTLKKTINVANRLVDEVFKNESRAGIIQYINQPGQLMKFIKKTAISDDYYVNLPVEERFLRVLTCKIENIGLLHKLVMGRIYQDFKPYSDTFTILDNQIILVNETKKILLHVYDDRGCDVFCKEEQDYLELKQLFKKYIDSYTAQMEELNYQVQESTYGVSFTKK
ncbi:DUF3885 domain-containing protein [Enterococcus sp. LJL128]